MKKLFIVLAFLLFALPAQATLWDYFGGQLPSLAYRAKIYAQIASDRYLGTASQNNALEANLRSSERKFGAAVKPFRPSGYESTLASSLAEGGSETTLKVNSLTLPDGTSIASTSFGTLLILTVGEGDGEEKIAVNDLTASTKTFTILSRGLEYGRWASSTANMHQHLPGERVYVSNDDHFMYELIPDLVSNETIAGIKTFSSFPLTPSSAPTSDYQVANKKYIDDAVIVGGVPATNGTAGVSKVSTKAQAAAGTSGDGTYYYLLPSSMATSTSQVATTSIPITNTSGKLDSSFIDQTANYSWSGTNTFSASSTFNGFTINPRIINAYMASTTLTGSTLPQPVYIATTTGNIMLSNASFTASSTFYQFHGFAVSSAVDGGTVYVQTDGKVGGFTGLTKGSNYYVSNTNGTISTTRGNVPIKVGRAVSTTEILITHDKVWGVPADKKIGSNNVTYYAYTNGEILYQALDNAASIDCDLTITDSSGAIFQAIGSTPAANKNGVNSSMVSQGDTYNLNCSGVDSLFYYWRPYN